MKPLPLSMSRSICIVLCIMIHYHRFWQRLNLAILPKTADGCAKFAFGTGHTACMYVTDWQSPFPMWNLNNSVHISDGVRCVAGVKLHARSVLGGGGGSLFVRRCPHFKAVLRERFQQ